MTWASLWWRVSLLVRLHARRAHGAWIVWRRHHRKARPIRYAVLNRPRAPLGGTGEVRGRMVVPWSGEAAWGQLGIQNVTIERQRQLQGLMGNVQPNPYHAQLSGQAQDSHDHLRGALGAAVGGLFGGMR